jgi:hypothetical protein
MVLGGFVVFPSSGIPIMVSDSWVLRVSVGTFAGAGVGLVLRSFTASRDTFFVRRRTLLLALLGL